MNHTLEIPSWLPLRGRLVLGLGSSGAWAQPPSRAPGLDGQGRLLGQLAGDSGQGARGGGKRRKRQGGRPGGEPAQRGHGAGKQEKTEDHLGTEWRPHRGRGQCPERLLAAVRLLEPVPQTSRFWGIQGQKCCTGLGGGLVSVTHTCEDRSLGHLPGGLAGVGPR